MNHIEIIADMEQKLFRLHPQAKDYYNTIRILKSEYDSQGASDLIQQVVGNGKTKRLAYNVKDKTANKIIIVLRGLSKFSRIGDVFNGIKEYEPAFKGQLNTALNVLKEDNIIAVLKPTGSNRDTFYGFKQWLNEGGTPKTEYMYDESSIISKDYINLEDLNE